MGKPCVPLVILYDNNRFKKTMSLAVLANYRFFTYSVRCKLKHDLTKLYSSILHQNILNFSSSRKLVLGIETSCDDTGVAVVDDRGEVLGNSLHSQLATTIELGGVVPTEAKALHQKHIDRVVNEAMREARLEFKDLDAIAVTNEPGLALSLEVGLSYAKSLVKQHRLPMIPIHHMQAHALTARMIKKIDFPFLVLLASGGHCLLAVARDVDEFLLLGTCIQKVAPGEVLDKVARSLKLKTLPECHGLCGGAMVERIALHGDPYRYTMPDPLTLQKDCDFSFAGIKGAFNVLLKKIEKEQGVEGSQMIDGVADICASVQFFVLRHIMKRLQRCFLFCLYKDLLPESKTLVVSGGVACNKYIRSGLQNICDQFDYRLVCPPPHLCTDNGIMIAWNGMEKLKIGRGFADSPEDVRFYQRKAIGDDMRNEVCQAYLKTKPTLTVDKIHYF